MQSGASQITEAHARELNKQKKRKAELAEQLQNDLAGVSSILFEAGCGHGHWLTDYGQKHSETICVGIDLISWRIRKGIEKVKKRGLKNVHFYKADLSEFLEALPKEIQFERTVLLFPDPWPKARHHRRRMVQAGLLSQFAQRSLAGASFCFRSDDSDYFDWTVEHLEEHPDWKIDSEADWPYESETYFQSLMDSYQSVVARKN